LGRTYRRAVRVVTPEGKIGAGKSVIGQALLSASVTNDKDSGEGSLREAIRQANTRPGTVIRFPKDQRLIIYPTSPLPPITANGTVFDGPSGTVVVRAFPPTFPPSNATYTGPLAWILGDRAGTTASGLVVQGSNCTLRGLLVSGFALNQI